MAAVKDFMLLLAALLNLEFEQVTQGVFERDWWYVSPERIERILGIKGVGVHQALGYTWKVEYDGPKDNPHQYIRKLTFIGRFNRQGK